MTRIMTWNDVLKRDNLIGGDIESRESGIVYRGPLGGIKADGNIICFSSPWCARLNPETGEWENWSVTSSFFVSREMVAPQDIGAGRVFFFLPFLGTCTIFPRNGSKLEAHKVRGLAKDSDRFRALFPRLSFDRVAVERVCCENTFPRVLENLSALPVNASIDDVLALFKHDSQAEEFLWYYVETVTGEKDLYNRVY